MIRISTEPQGDQTVVTVDGWLAEPDLGELRRVRQSVAGPVALKLAGLEACVPAGLGLLQEWLDAGAHLESASPFLQIMLETGRQTCGKPGICVPNGKPASVS